MVIVRVKFATCSISLTCNLVGQGKIKDTMKDKAKRKIVILK